MGNKWDKFLLLMWKNYKLQIRRPIQTLFEICVPIFFACLLLLMRSVINPVEQSEVIYGKFSPFPQSPQPTPNPTTTSVSLYTTSPTSTSKPSSNNETKPLLVCYYPQGVDTDGIMNYFDKLSNLSDIKGFKDKTEFENWYVVNGTRAAIALEFSGTIDKNLHVAIRLYSGSEAWNTNRLYPVYQVPGPRNPDGQFGGPPDYYANFFPAMQELVTASAMLYQRGNMNILSRMKTLSLSRFPYGSYLDDPLLPAMQTSMGMIFLLAFMFTCTCTVKAITTEKQKQLKEAMKIMGLPGWLHWTAWFVKSFIFLFITVFIIGVLMKIKIEGQSIITYSNYFLFVIFLLLYMCATITFCFAISVFFSKANIAATIAGLTWFLMYIPYSFLQTKYDTLSLSAKMLSCLGFNSGMAYGFQLFIMFEGTMEGINWNNFYKPIDSDDNLSLLHVMIMLIVDSIIHVLIALYFEAIFPGEFGIPKPWYFPCTRSYWFGDYEYNDYIEASNEGEYFEEEPKNFQVGVQIKNLRKVFGGNEAVKGLSLNMFHNQITVLLGHNGAGKTTTMSMLTGMFPPTSGTAIVDGCDIRTNIDGVRKSLGLCPQHNVIFDDLTVREHLYFFCKLKGLTGKEIEYEIKKYIDLLELKPKENAKSATLSGGMKRKLCVGMALCGNSQVVMLDEPTAGMDPSARRSLWNLIQDQKKGRTILLTTHFMDEADLLGDRIAIMAGGKLQCCGSSFFLKKKYGAGYHLIMDKTPECRPEIITNLLRKYIPNIKVESDIASELRYLLSENQSLIFEEMLSELESKSEELGVRSYGISLTTLEEVFLKVGVDFETASTSQSVSELDDFKVDIGKPCLVDENTLMVNQIYAMVVKKAVTLYRTWIQHLIQFIVPVIFISLAVTIAKNNENAQDMPALDLTLDDYDHPVTLVSDSSCKFDPIIANYRQSVGQRISTVSDIVDKMVHLTKNTPTTTRKQYIVGLSCANNEIISWFNNDAYHALPLSFGLALNAFYMTLGSNKTISFSNYPLPHTMEDSLKNLDGMNSSGFIIAYQLGFSMAFTSAFFILFYIRERVSKSKHLQFVSGVKVLVFWFVSFLWDVLVYTLVIVLCIITLLAFQEKGFNTADELGRQFVVLLCFCLSVLPLMYLCSYFFSIPTTGLTVMTLIGVFAGNAGLILIQVLSQPKLKLTDLSNTLHWIFLFIPHYSMSSGMVDSYMKYMFNDVCQKQIDLCVANHFVHDCAEYMCNMTSSCCNLNNDYFAWEKPGLGSNITISVLSGFLFMVILIANEYGAFSCIYYLLTQRSAKMPVIVEDEDSDVYEEKMVIQQTSEATLTENYSLVLKDLTKYYKDFMAVNGLNLGIKKSECFGLLGINGAGKTSTFKMMTGDETLSYGNAWVNSYSIRNQMNMVKKFIGYCPQFDALLDDLTTRQTLRMFCLIRGVPTSDCDVVIEALARDLDFTKHLDKQIKQLSGGNKRKVSTAIALIGDPPVIYLDEPTTGMDPATKRHLWDALSKIREQGKCIVLTSHSMEECEALCTRLAIMVNGNFKCLGSVQHLKNKFAEGYTLIIKIKKNEMHNEELEIRAIQSYVESHFGKVQLRERHEGLITYYITDKSLPWSRMFGILERAKTQLNIEDYSLAQSSLEQVFLTFTKYQIISD